MLLLLVSASGLQISCVSESLQQQHQCKECIPSSCVLIKQDPKAKAFTSDVPSIFCSARKKGSCRQGLWKFPQHPGRGATAPSPTQEELHEKEGYRGLSWVHNTARMELAPPHFHQPPQLRNIRSYSVLRTPSGQPLAFLQITKRSNSIKLSLALGGLRFSPNKLYKQLTDSELK